MGRYDNHKKVKHKKRKFQVTFICPHCRYKDVIITTLGTEKIQCSACYEYNTTV